MARGRIFSWPSGEVGISEYCQVICQAEAQAMDDGGSLLQSQTWYQAELRQLEALNELMGRLEREIAQWTETGGRLE